MHITIKIRQCILAILALIILPLPVTAAAGQIPLKEEINSNEFNPDIMHTGTEEERDGSDRIQYNTEDGSDDILYHTEDATDDNLPKTGKGSLAPIFLTLAIISLGFATLVGVNE